MIPPVYDLVDSWGPRHISRHKLKGISDGGNLEISPYDTLNVIAELMPEQALEYNKEYIRRSIKGSKKRGSQFLDIAEALSDFMIVMPQEYEKEVMQRLNFHAADVVQGTVYSTGMLAEVSIDEFLEINDKLTNHTKTSIKYHGAAIIGALAPFKPELLTERALKLISKTQAEIRSGAVKGSILPLAMVARRDLAMEVYNHARKLDSSDISLYLASLESILKQPIDTMSRHDHDFDLREFIYSYITRERYCFLSEEDVDMLELGKQAYAQIIKQKIAAMNSVRGEDTLFLLKYLNSRYANFKPEEELKKDINRLVVSSSSEPEEELKKETSRLVVNKSSLWRRFNNVLDHNSAKDIDEIIEWSNIHIGAGYTVVKFLAEGGMSKVYLATDTANKYWVIKIPEANRRKELMEKFKIKTMSELAEKMYRSVHIKSNYVCTSISITLPDGTPAQLEEPVEKTWKDAMQESGNEKMNLEMVALLGSDIALGIKDVHNNGIVHLDIKPDNCGITTQKSPYFIKIDRQHKYVISMLFDFNIATADQPEDVRRLREDIGGILVRAPEISLGRYSPEKRTDIFEFANTLYWAIVGTPPLLIGTTGYDMNNLPLREQDGRAAFRREIEDRINSDKYYNKSFNFLGDYLELKGTEIDWIKSHSPQSIRSASRTEEHLLGMNLQSRLAYTIHWGMQKSTTDRFNSALPMAIILDPTIRYEPLVTLGSHY